MGNMTERIVFKKAVKVKLTAGRIAAFNCPQDKSQVFYGVMILLV